MWEPKVGGGGYSWDYWIGVATKTSPRLREQLEKKNEAATVMLKYGYL